MIKKNNLWRNGVKNSCYGGWASTGESEIGTNLPEKETADHDPSFCFHFLSFAVLASIPKRLSHNLPNWPYVCPGTLKE
jgi:hypothetical protein